MVVTRKAPVPPTPTSRTSSSQAVPRVVKAKPIPNSPESPSLLVHGNSRNDIDRDLSKGASNDDTPKKGKGKAKWKKRGEKKLKKSRTRGFFDFLTNIFITSIIIYSFTVCPNTHQTPQPPICYALSEYRRLVLEPYIFPPMQRVFAHPSIAPYVEIVQPHVTHAIAVTKPIVIRAQTEFNSRIVPQWDKYVVPQYNAYIAPHIHKVEEQLQPYRILAKAEYERYVGPYVRLATITLWKWQQQAQPYISVATNKSYDGYKAMKPYARPIWEHLKVLGLRLIQLADQCRRQFVDPHVAKMWTRIEELSTGKKYSPSVSESVITPTPAHPLQIEEFETVAAVPIEEFTGTATSFPGPVPTSEPLASLPISAGDETVAAETETASSVVVTPAALEFFSNEPTEPVEVLSETLEAIVDVATETPAPEEVPFAFPAPTRIKEISSEIPTAASPPSLEITGPSATPTPPSSDYDEVDLDAFYAELGLHESVATETGQNDEQVPFSAPPQESEEERAARLAALKDETAQKRNEITGRHTKWEIEMDELIIEEKKVLKKALVALRKTAAAEFNENVDIRTAVDSLVGDAEKYIKGADGYLTNLSKEDRKEEEKKALWARVVDKVDEKFLRRLQETEVVVNEWYGLVLQAELQEIGKVTAPVQETASSAQADIGLDYAWLGDVTYEDWQRYHDLMRRSENFAVEAAMIQNGTHISPPINPVLLAIQDLRAEVEDIIVGFETRLRRIKRKGDRVFGNVIADDEASKDEDSEKPVASVLPIIPEVIKETGPRVVIGKSQEQVLQALENAGQGAAAPTSSSSPEEDVNEIVREAEEAVHVHEEL